MISTHEDFGFTDYDEYPPAHRNIAWGRVAIIAVVVLLALAFAGALRAEVMMQRGVVVCYPEAQVTKGLLQDAGEQVVIEGITKAGQILRLYSTPDGSTWTATILLAANHMSCTMAAGRNLELRPLKAPDEPS